MEQKKPFVLTEETLRENEKLIKLITEEQRYRQSARLRALEIAQLEVARAGGDIISDATKYYNWLMEIASGLLNPTAEK